MLMELTADTIEKLGYLMMRFLLYYEMKKVILPRWKKDIIHKL
jgi:hypothetical protein